VRRTAGIGGDLIFVMPVTSQCRSQGKKDGVRRGENAMKTYFLGLLALVAFVSALAIQGLHARNTPPVYVVVEIDEITDANGFEALRQAADATAIEAQFEDGRYFARTENVTALDGNAPKSFTIIAFDNITKAKTFADSIKATTALRTRVTKSRSFIVEGTMR
jgi:uncharacterized protein (DUF1330 family)